MAFSPNAAMDGEITFLTGVTSSGSVAGTSFWTWNQDTPATYSSTRSDAAKWGAPTAGTSGGVVTYSFDAASNWTSTEEAAFASTYALWAAVANVSFQMVAPGSSADVVITRSSGSGNSDGGITSLYLGQIGTTQVGQAATASIEINTSLYGEGPLGSSFSNFGGYPWETILHEEGHTLGLGHAGAYDGTVNSTTQQYSLYDGREWSIMSYINPFDTSQADYGQEPVKNGDWGISASTDGSYSYNVATTWMPLDILAIQRLYGLPVTTPLSGGQTFGFNSNIVGPIEPFFDFTQNTRPVITLWDEGGGNTLDLSGYAMTNVVDLHAGAFSSVGGLTHNVVIAFGVAIDTVIGGTGSDSLTANDDGDHLVGGLGNDELGAGLGKDTLDGGAGNDEFYGLKAQLSGDAILDFTYGDTIWIKDGAISDHYVITGNQLSWSTGSLTLDDGALGYVSVTADAAGGVDITFGGGSAASSSLSGGDTLVTSTDGSYVINQTVYAIDGYELYSNFYDATGRLTKQMGFASNGVETAEIDHFGDGSSLNLTWNIQGVLISQIGYTPQGSENYANLYDGSTGRLVQQLAFSASGVKTAEIDDASDGSSLETTWSATGTLINIEQFDTAGRPVWKNTYGNSGLLVEQDGYASNGVKVIEIDHGATTSLTTTWSSAGFITQQVSVYNGGSYDFIKTYGATGNLVEWDVYSSSGFRQVETDYGSDGSSTVKTYASPGTTLLSQIGHSSSGAETYANFYDPSTGRLYEQDAFTSGVKTYENDHAADGSFVVKTFNAGAALLSVAGYTTTGQESYANFYDGATGRLTVQQGFDSSGVKTAEIDHAADGSFTNSQFSASGLTQETFYDSNGAALAVLSRSPSNGVYSLTGDAAGVTLSAIPGTGTLSAEGGSTIFSVAQGFDIATVSNFTPTGSGQDFVRVDSHLAADYAHLMADASNINGDVLFAFSATDHLVLHGLQIAQLNQGDFLFV